MRRPHVGRSANVGLGRICSNVLKSYPLRRIGVIPKFLEENAVEIELALDRNWCVIKI